MPGPGVHPLPSGTGAPPEVVGTALDVVAEVGAAVVVAPVVALVATVEVVVSVEAASSSPHPATSSATTTTRPAVQPTRGSRRRCGVVVMVSPAGSSTEAVEHVGGDLFDVAVVGGEAVGPVGGAGGHDRAARGRGPGAEHGMAVGQAVLVAALAEDP